MRDANRPVVKICQIEAAVLLAMVRFMYGRLDKIPSNMLVPVFIAADAQWVNQKLCVLGK